MKKRLFLLCWLTSQLVQGQIAPSEKEWINNGLSHSSVKANSFENLDSLLSTDKQTKWNVFPEVIFGNKMQTGVGIALETSLNQKWAIQLRYSLGYTNSLNKAYSTEIQPRAYFTNQIGNQENYLFNDLRFRLTYRPIKYVEFQTGIDRQHIGEGDRSLMMDQHSAPSPFAKMVGKIWRLEYHFMQQLWSEGMFTSNYRPKGNASHYVSYKINKNFQVGIFESVVYGMKDTLYNRGFELEYANPFIFFRPQEYGVGSTDNVILGLNASYQTGNHMVYGSFVLDEFFLKEIRERSRWWANKYAAQLGYKVHFEKGKNQYFNRIEANLVRPFTYTQLRPDVVYANENLPIAHPLGANFLELYEEFNWKFKRFDFTFFASYYLKGNKLPLDNPGGDIYIPYTDRKEEYNYTIGRGETTHQLLVGAHLAYQLSKLKWSVFVEPRFYFQNIEKIQNLNSYVSVGIHRSIGSNRRNF